MTFDLGGHKIEISRARLNYCGVHRFHASFMARHGQDAASKGIGLICESIMSDEAIRSMRRNVDEIGHVFGMSTVLPFRVYTELYFEDAVGYLESIGCHCYQKDECVKMFAPDRKEYMQGVAELLDKGLLKGLLDDTAGLIDTLDTQLQMMDSGFASDAEIAERQEEVLDSFRSKLRTLIGKFFGRRNVSDAFGNAFDKMFDLLRLNLCKAATLAGDRFACEPTSEDELEMACKVCESLKGNDVEESKVVPVCLGVLQIAPHLAAAYPPLYIRVGDKSGDLSRLAELAGVKDMDVLKECILPRLYSHTRIRELSNIDAFRKDLHEKWAFYALDDKPEEWSFYVAVKRSAEMVRSTFHRRRLSSPELADHYRAVYKLLCDSDFATSQESAEGARNAVVALARKLDVPTDWLESILEEKTRLLQIRLYDDLKEYLCSLDLSTEEKAIAARDAVRCEALRIGYKAFCNFPPLEALISRYDCKARSVLGREFPTREEASAHRRIFERIVSTDFQSSSECCKLALNECVKMASEDGIDADWLISDLHTALRRHDEESRVRMGYLYATHEEADAAYKEPELVFRAVWSAVKRFAQTNSWLCSCASLPSGTLSRLTSRANVPADDIFAYYNPEVLTSGQLGLWFCKAGVCICCGSVLAEKIVRLKAISRWTPRKFHEWMESKLPKVSTLPWSSVVASTSGEVRVVKSGLEFPGGFVFSCNQKKALALKALFDELRAIGAGLECDLSQDALEVPSFENVQGNIHFTDWPSKKKEDTVPVALEESDFADRPKEPAMSDEPEDYSSSLEMIIEDSRSDAAEHGVKTAQDFTASDTVVFTEKPIDGVSISNNDILCVAKESGMLKSKVIVALTDSYLLIASGGERHAYHMAELELGLKSESRISLSVLRLASVDTHLASGGTIHRIDNIELKGSGVEYILGVVGKFLGRTLVFGH